MNIYSTVVDLETETESLKMLHDNIANFLRTIKRRERERERERELLRGYLQLSTNDNNDSRECVPTMLRRH